jgi:hypothetical protein
MTELTYAMGLNKKKPYKSEKLDLVVRKMESLVESNFTGYVKINFTQGSIGRVEKFEEILKDLKSKG